MLPSLEIENFRTFSHLEIEHLGQVNLIVGRNNVGKTMLLEALRLYCSLGEPIILVELLQDRDEILPGTNIAERQSSILLQVESLFHNHRTEIGEGNAIRIGPCSATDLTLELRMKVFRHDRSMPDFPERVSMKPATKADLQTDPEAFLALETLWRKQQCNVLPVENLAKYRLYSMRSLFASSMRYAFVPAAGIDPEELGREWDKIVLHDAEERVKECLAIIAPVERITAIECPGSRGDRIFVARLSGQARPVPLKSLGDGMVRLFQISLALESAIEQEGLEPSLLQRKAIAPEFGGSSSLGILLIDEIENGIHYSALPDLWRFVFHMARLRGVQVFATTHSWDCISAFQEVASEDRETEGALIRLEKDNEINRAVVFTENELSIVARDNIEVR